MSIPHRPNAAVTQEVRQRSQVPTKPIDCKWLQHVTRLISWVLEGLQMSYPSRLGEAESLPGALKRGGQPYSASDHTEIILVPANVNFDWFLFFFVLCMKSDHVGSTTSTIVTYDCPNLFALNFALKDLLGTRSMDKHHWPINCPDEESTGLWSWQLLNDVFQTSLFQNIIGLSQA